MIQISIQQLQLNNIREAYRQIRQIRNLRFNTIFCTDFVKFFAYNENFSKRKVNEYRLSPANVLKHADT